MNSNMANINAKFKKILKDIEENIKNKEDFEFVKTQMFHLYNAFFEEMNRIEETANTKIAAILETEVRLQEKVEKIEKGLKEIQGDIYDEEEFSITCPYCSNEFVLDCEELKAEVKCPECDNVIELDWGDEEEEGSCGCGGCHGCHHPEEDDM